MNFQTKYVYRLGHQPEFGANEFSKISKTIPNFYNYKYLFSDHLVDINQTGALVFRAEIVAIEPRTTKFKHFLTDSLKEAFLQNPDKKIGLALPNSELNQKQIILMAKTIGYKKINVLEPDLEPNFGNFLHTPNWFIAFEIEDNWLLAKVEQFSDQEFWSLLDRQLPVTDMKRGLINLKLARTLMNFSENLKIWDPFCGVGRNFVSAVDLKSQFIGSDISAECLNQATLNFNFALNYYPDDIPKAHLKDIFEADVTKLEKDDSGFFNNFSIVSEGYLGHNFVSQPTLKDQQNELKRITELWKLALKNFQKLKISEIVTCLPFYSFKNSNLEVNLDELITGTKYKYNSFLNSKKALYYRRKSSFVGHQVVVFQLLLD